MNSFRFLFFYTNFFISILDNGNGAFVIASGAILGVASSFLWVSQGAIMTTYVPESHKGRAIALFWVIFNLGGAIGSLASFGINFHSKKGTVSNSTYIAYLVIMVFGWLLSIFICDPSSIRGKGAGTHPEAEVMKSWRRNIMLSLRTISNWRVLCLLPLFFSANIFYSYQQNYVNGKTFDIRTRSLNGALYWIAQMVGGLLIGVILDLPMLNRRWRGVLGWTTLFVTGMAIWGGGYAFQVWSDRRQAKGLKQDIDYTHGSLSAGPIMLYIFYGGYDSLWQSFCYWMIGASSNSPRRTAILVGAYKAFQAAGGAMAWRINALGRPAMTQFAMNWGLCMGTLVVALPSVLSVSITNDTTTVESVAKPEESEDMEPSAERLNEIKLAEVREEAKV